MAQLQILGQKPSVELEVKAKDASKVVQTLIVGFKRHKTKDAKLRIETYDNIIQADTFDLTDSPRLDQFLREEVLYMLKVSLTVVDEETGETQTLRIPDTRKAVPVDSLWKTPEECLSMLMDAYLPWSSWKMAFLPKVQSALIESDTEAATDEGVRKN